MLLEILYHLWDFAEYAGASAWGVAILVSLQRRAKSPNLWQLSEEAARRLLNRSRTVGSGRNAASVRR